MAKFTEKVDKTITLVKERKVLSLDALAYELGLSPDYARKVAHVAVCVCSDPPLILEELFEPGEGRGRPSLFVKSHFEELDRSLNPWKYHQSD